VTMRRTLTSWDNVVSSPTAATQLPWVVHGALQTYDLPDLVAALGAGKITIAEPVDALGKVITAQ